ncbi:MoaD/ThiS family protein [Demequina sp. NBRC 110054]|uniref:MoaD/ThiS family protein n=1 Tax=Demequina sp. NBRC 110054 TaxID=1570343 RepID=UPI000A009A52|nr:MoaD/ThiS family protein [Demequina sp. NBRC 110054]
MSHVVRLFAGAAEAAGVAETSASATTEDALRSELALRFGEGFGPVLAKCSLMADGTLLEPGEAIPDGATVDVLPPFAGG